MKCVYRNHKNQVQSFACFTYNPKYTVYLVHFLQLDWIVFSPQSNCARVHLEVGRDHLVQTLSERLICSAQGCDRWKRTRVSFMCACVCEWEITRERERDTLTLSVCERQHTQQHRQNQLDGSFVDHVTSGHPLIGSSRTPESPSSAGSHNLIKIFKKLH